MKFEFTESWCSHAAEREGNLNISAGILPWLSTQPQPNNNVTEELQIAFGKFVRLMRKSRNLRLEELANQTDIDLEELVCIELNQHHSPEPRAVYNLAIFFGIPDNAMLQLSGLSSVRNRSLVEEAVRFAARSEPLENLKAEEEAALMHFVSVLSGK